MKKLNVIDVVEPGDFVKGERDGQIGLVIKTSEEDTLIVQYPSGEWGSIANEYILEARRN